MSRVTWGVVGLVVIGATVFGVVRLGEDDDDRAMPDACHYWTDYANAIDHSPDGGLTDDNIDRANKIFLVREKACARE